MELLHMLLYAVDAAEGYQIGNARGDDSQADEPGEGSACHIRVLESEEAEDGSGDAEQERGPPGGETGRDIVTNRLCPRKMTPRIICRMEDSMRVPLLVRFRSLYLKIPTISFTFCGRYAEQEQYRRTVHRFDGDIVWRSGKLLGVQSATINPLMLMLASDALTGV